MDGLWIYVRGWSLLRVRSNTAGSCQMTGLGDVGTLMKYVVWPEETNLIQYVQV